MRNSLNHYLGLLEFEPLLMGPDYSIRPLEEAASALNRQGLDTQESPIKLTGYLALDVRATMGVIAGVWLNSNGVIFACHYGEYFQMQLPFMMNRAPTAPIARWEDISIMPISPRLYTVRYVNSEYRVLFKIKVKEYEKRRELGYAQ